MTLTNGIYFNIPFEVYDKIERLSKSRLKKIMISPADFWADSWLNPTPKKLTPEQEKNQHLARLLGRAYHCARLEPDQWPIRFVRKISQADYADAEGFIGTGAAIEAELARRELPKKKSDDGGVLGQARRLADAGYEGTIWHIVEADWLAQKGEREAIPAESFDQIEIDMLRLAAVPDVQAALSNGYAEVSILYDCPDTGLPMKARLDYLRGDGWAEFKSFANTNGKPLDQCILDAIRFNRYYIDVAAYHEAVEQVRHGLVTIQGEHDQAQADMVDEIALQLRPLPHKLIFQQKGGVPNIVSRDLRLFDVHMSAKVNAAGLSDEAKAKSEESMTRATMLMAKARAEIRRAKKTFIGYSEIYERGQPWVPFDPHAEISDLDFHQTWLETL